MLDAMRRHAYSWFTRAVLIFLALILTFWGLGSSFLTQVKPVAEVNGQRILAEQVETQAGQMRERLSRMYGANASTILKNANLRQQALDQLIERQLIADEAHHLGIQISTEALQSRIQSDTVFQQDGQFDFTRYQEILENNNLTPSEYESDQRDSMEEGALRGMIDAGVMVSEGEVKHAFDIGHQKIGLRYAEFPYADFTAKISPSEKDIQDYYAKHSEQFREPERVKIVFIHYEPEAMAANYTPTDKEIKDVYDRYAKTRFSHPEEARAHHILIAVPAGASDADKAKAKAKAQDVLKQAQSGGDFAALASKYSDDPGSRHQGGDLGTFGRGQMVKPFENMVFSMKPGQISFVETQFGFHVIRLDELKPAHSDTIDEARQGIIDELRQDAGKRLVNAALQGDVSAAAGGANLQDLAKKRSMEAVETPFFGADDPNKPADLAREVISPVFAMTPGQVRAVPAQEAPYLIKLLDRKESRIPPLKEIEPQVREALIRTLAEDQAQAAAQKMLAGIKSPADFDASAAANHLIVKSIDPFSATTQNVPGIGPFPEVSELAGLAPSVPAMLERTMRNGGNAYIFELTSRTGPTDEDWQSAKQSFTQQYLYQRRSQAWSQFLDQLKDQASIKIDTEQLGAASSM
ncbi:MAG TPA: SurA N-terminal domain-containing protein [Candidatus Binataceae bacterium]|nr:SurA N-terminal domain-containing protein [Candidatus Binataceae bacterium]